MRAGAVNSTGFMAKSSARNTQIVISAQKGNARELQSQVDTATTQVLKRAYMPFEAIQRDMYLKNGGLMGLGLAVGSSLDKTG